MEIQIVQNQLVEDDFTAISSALQIKEQMIGNYKVQAVDGRQLWNALGVKTRFTDWAKDQIANNGYIENVDWTVSKISTAETDGTVTPGAVTSQMISVYTFPINIAKEIALMAKTEQGKFVRRYFIKMETIAQKAIQSKTPQTYIEALKETLRLAEANEELKAREIENAPKVEFYDNYITHGSAMTIGEFAKILLNNNVRDVDDKVITSKTIYDIFRKYGFILKNSNYPSQEMITKGWMVIESNTRKNSATGQNILDNTGKPIATRTTKITADGEANIIRRLIGKIGREKAMLVSLSNEGEE